jgi:putative membrane protein
MPPSTHREPLILLAIVTTLLLLSGLYPADRLTWLLEVAPVLLAIPILLLTAKRFPLTPLSYRLIFLHSLVLMVGAHYTYAKVPLGSWVQEWLGLARNHYDRFGHFVQGFVPAIIVREVLLRRTPLGGGWLFFLVCCVCLAFSAFYEFLEWWTAVIVGGPAEDFLATQGDPWDTQWDMFMALVGAAVAQLTLGRMHDLEMKKLPRV